MTPHASSTIAKKREVERVGGIPQKRLTDRGLSHLLLVCQAITSSWIMPFLFSMMSTMQQANVPSPGNSKTVDKSLGLLKRRQRVTAGTDLQPHAGHPLPLGLCRSPDALKE